MNPNEPPANRPEHDAPRAPIAEAGRPGTPLILTINGGSSSIKFALFSTSPLARTLTGQVERIGLPNATLTGRPANGKPVTRAIPATDFRAAANAVIDYIREALNGAPLSSIAHRVVHGGVHLLEHQLITPDLIAELKRTQPLDLAHLPREIALIESMRAAFPAIPQIACFDTAFHRDMPPVAQRLPIPRKYADQGFRRFGFHGLSYSYLMKRLAQLDPAAARGRVILAHLGSGASMAAVRDGKPIDTTMGFTPISGLVMGTRPGDLDPGLLVYLARVQNMSADAMDEFISHECGLIGISQTSPDMRDLLARQATDERAANAVELFHYAARKHLGALHAILGGLDTLIFAGGIGEHSRESRAGICAGLNHLGIEIDAARNAANADIISTNTSRVIVRIISTDEELELAQIASSFLSMQSPVSESKSARQRDLR